MHNHPKVAPTEFRVNLLRIAALLIVSATGLSAAAPKISVTPDRTQVAVGEHVRITVKLVSDKQLSGVDAPRLPSSEFYTVAGTNQNQTSSTSVQIVNGKMVQRTEVTYFFYYTIIPKKKGTFTFPALNISADGETLQTQPVSMTVGAEPVENPEVRVRLWVSKRDPYVFEQITMTLEAAKKERSSAQLTRDGFWGAVEELTNALDETFSVTALLQPNQEIKGVRERIDGEFYHVFRIKLALFPLQSGTVVLPRVAFRYVVQQQVQSRSRDPFFDGFFGMGSSVRRVPKSAFTGAVKITCRDLPAAPDNFSGAVGSFSLSVDVDPKTLPAGDAATLKVFLRGNTPASSMPDPELPSLEEFEVFTPEKSVSSDTSSNGLSARKSYKYLVVPQQEGELVIPPVTWTYFDPLQEQFRTLKSDAITMQVTRGKGGAKGATNRYLTQSEIREIGQDIRYIKTTTSIQNQPAEPYENPVFYVLYPLPFLLALFSFMYRVQATKPRDTAKALSTKAGGRARKEIGDLRKQHARFSPKELLSRISGVIESYISHRFNFAATGKTLDQLKAELIRRGVREEIVTDLAQFIETMDKYRFGGMAVDESAKSIMLDKTEAFVQQLEKSARKERKA